MSEKKFGQQPPVEEVESTTSPVSTETTNETNNSTEQNKVFPPGFAFSENEDPVVILFGQSKCGKTTALVRLIRYLEAEYVLEETVSKKYHLAYTKTYNGNKSYEAISEAFRNTCMAPINLTDGGTNDTFLCSLNFDHTNQNSEDQRNCRILEAPGEDLFPIKISNIRQRNGQIYYTDWLADILAEKKMKRVWVFFMDPSFIFSGEEDISTENSRYVQTIKNIARQVPNDKFIFLVNKYDLVSLKRGESIEQYINNNYGQVLTVEPFERPGRIAGRFNIHRQYSIIEFCAISQDSRRTNVIVNDGDPKYPEALWNKIQELIKQ